MALDVTTRPQQLAPEPVVDCKLTAEDLDLALLTYAIHPDAAKASAMLKSAGIDVAARTLQSWRTKKYPNRFALLQEAHAREIEDQIANGALVLAQAAQAATMESIELERQRVAAGEVKDASSSARNMATAFGIAVDKSLLLHGRPTVITEARGDPFASLIAKGLIIETTDEIPDADVVEAREHALPQPPDAT